VRAIQNAAVRMAERAAGGEPELVEEAR
jgi:hypothetical protein